MDNLGDWDTFTPTTKQLQRYRDWLDRYVAVVIEGLVANGEVDATDIDALDLIDHAVRTDMSVASRPDWMPPRRAHAEIVTMTDELITDPVRRLDMQDALRTMRCLSDHAAAVLVAELAGVTVYTAKQYNPDRMANLGLSGRTCLYRYHDDVGILLYVGISKDPGHREQAHARFSEWFEWSARRDDAWFETREAALAGERDAIAIEGPLFNRLGSVLDEDEAEDYLLFRELARQNG